MGMDDIDCRGENLAINRHEVLETYLLEVSVRSNKQTIDVRDGQGVVVKDLHHSAGKVVDIMLYLRATSVDSSRWGQKNRSFL